MTARDLYLITPAQALFGAVSSRLRRERAGLDRLIGLGFCLERRVGIKILAFLLFFSPVFAYK